METGIICLNLSQYALSSRTGTAFNSKWGLSGLPHRPPHDSPSDSPMLPKVSQ